MKRTSNGIPANVHAVFDATLVTGATTGAVAGAVGGPAGVIAGGTIGAAVGALAGAVLDRETHHAELHDRELDAIGAPGHPAIRASKTAITAAVLRAEHARLEVIYERLLDAYRFGDWNDVRAQWAIFEPSLRAHMALEEERIFPAFREVDAVEAERLLEEHDALRRCLGALGINIELHAVTPLDANALIEKMRRHRDREESLLYPWIDETFSAG